MSRLKRVNIFFVTVTQWPEVESLTPEQDLHPLGHLALKYILVCDHFLPKIFFTGLLSVE